MSEHSSATVINLEATQKALCDHFLGWQCRLRQMSTRQAEGRPSAGMQPSVYLPDATEPLATITVLIIKSEPEETTAQLRHMVRKTHDPADRYASALTFLAATYYQKSKTFSDRMTALFGPDSAIAAHMLEQSQCRLDFEQYNQRYGIPCAVRRLTAPESAYQATYWHNSLFNPNLPADVQILQFRPDWARAEADPAAS